MAWKLEIWWGYSNKCSCPIVDEAFDTKAAGIAVAQEVLADGYTVTSPGNHAFYPASGITHVSLIEIEE